MIGWSWVLLTGEWILRAGIAGAALAFIAGSFVVMLIGLTYAELASMMPKVGGEHQYTLRALGYTPSFLASWAVVTATSPSVSLKPQRYQRHWSISSRNCSRD